MVRVAHALAALGVAAAAGCGAASTPVAQPTGPCGIPPGLDMQALAPKERGLVARRLLACQDLQHGRIDLAEYKARTEAIDAELGGRSRVPGASPVANQLAGLQWASDVIDVSSEYSKESWSAARVIGAPNVYPLHGDLQEAWASAGADDRAEWIQVAFEEPMRIDTIEIIETFNPGAVDRIEVIDRRGKRTLAWTGTAAPAGKRARRHKISIPCTAEPVVAVQVYLDSPSVPGWNEVDAIGIAPCAP